MSLYILVHIHIYIVSMLLFSITVRYQTCCWSTCETTFGQKCDKYFLVYVQFIDWPSTLRNFIAWHFVYVKPSLKLNWTIRRSMCTNFKGKVLILYRRKVMNSRSRLLKLLYLLLRYLPSINNLMHIQIENLFNHFHT